MNVLDFIRVAINEDLPDGLAISRDDISENYEEVVDFGMNHQITGLVAYAFEKIREAYGNEVVSDKELEKWKNYRYYVAGRNFKFDRERAEILAEMEKAGIWYLPLKGIILKDLYPQAGMREMSDNDILFDTNYEAEVKDIFLARGYECESYGEGHHDTYLKSPIFNFEMHTFLGEDGLELDVYNEYYRDPAKLMQKDDDNKYGYHMSNEDFYVYMIGHYFKHYNYAGVGIRSLIDIYVYLGKYNDTLDWDYIAEQFETIGIDEFHNTIKNLALKILSYDNKVLTSDEAAMLDFIKLSGVYGSEDISLKLKVQRAQHGQGALQSIDLSKESTAMGKTKYMLRRIFPTKEALIDRYEFCSKHPNLYWMIHFKRVRDAITVNSKRIIQEIKTFRKFK